MYCDDGSNGARGAVFLLSIDPWNVMKSHQSNILDHETERALDIVASSSPALVMRYIVLRTYIIWDRAKWEGGNNCLILSGAPNLDKTVQPRRDTASCNYLTPLISIERPRHTIENNLSILSSFYKWYLSCITTLTVALRSPWALFCHIPRVYIVPLYIATNINGLREWCQE